MFPVALTIAGFDPSSGAGVSLDMRIMQAHGVYPLAMITANTVQDSQQVYQVEAIAPDLLRQQLLRLLKDFPVGAIKTGLLPSTNTILMLHEMIPQNIPLIMDPVLRSSSGYVFLDTAGMKTLRETLMQRCHLITPNQYEAEQLSGIHIQNQSDVWKAAQRLLAFGVRSVLITGIQNSQNQAVDFFCNQETRIELAKPWLPGEVHGTGCALSAAICAELAKGNAISPAIQTAKEITFQRIQKARQLGRGLKHLLSK